MQAGDREKVGLQGLEVTRLGLGGTTFGNLYSALDEQEGLDVIDASYMAGGRYFDTAPLYGYGMSEDGAWAGALQPRRNSDLVEGRLRAQGKAGRRRLCRPLCRCAEADELFRLFARRGAALD